MNADDLRDQTVERLLGPALSASSAQDASPECLDADTLAAWVDGGLQGTALEMAVSHVAGCAHCQVTLAIMERATPLAPAALPWWRRSLRSVWLVPLTAGAAAVALWAIVPTTSPRNEAVREVTALAEQSSAVATAIAPAAAPPTAPDDKVALADRAEERAAAPTKQKAAANQQLASVRKERDEARKAEFEEPKPAMAAAPPLRQPEPSPPPAPSTPPATTTVAAGAAPAPAPPPPRPAAEDVARARDALQMVRRQDAGREVFSPNRAVRWRLGPAGAIDRSDDGGLTWSRLASGVSEDLTAGVSPAPSICWIVGRGGTVLRSTDGRVFARVTIPETLDLVRVEARDALNAVVTTSAGRTLSTSNGGQTWVRNAAQDF